MQSHGAGIINGTRPGAYPVIHNFELRFDTHVSGTDYQLCSLVGNLAQPGCFKVRAIVETPDNAVTSSVLRVGTSAGGTQILNDVDIKAAAGTNYAPAAASDIRLARAEQQVWARITRVGSSSNGVIQVQVECWDANVTPFSPNQNA